LQLNEQASKVIDLSEAIYSASLLDDSLNISSQSYLDESNASLSFQQNENDITISDIIILNENEDSQMNDLFNRKKPVDASGSLSGSSSPSIDDLVKRKAKKYAIEADQKLVASFDEIKPKLAHQVC
jgi:hypothetical protein